MMKPVQIKAKIVSQEKTSKRYFLLKIEVPCLFKTAQPGQFLHVKVNSSTEPLLRRPFSIYDVSIIKTRSSKQNVCLHILYEVKGKGTSLLAEKKAGDYINILGPLGRGFDYLQAGPKQQKTVVLLAAGTGVAPLYFLAHKISLLKKRTSCQNSAIVLIGAATASNILLEKEFRALGCQVHIATEDGSKGFKGKITDLWERMLSHNKILFKQSSKHKIVYAYACGPEAMLTQTAKICMMHKIPLQVSLEEFIGCGIGACLGCAVKTKDGYRRVCCDGPVFNSEEIAWKF